MFRPVWKGAVLAESDHSIKPEGSHYFTASPATSTCPVAGPGPLLPRPGGRQDQPERGLELLAAKARPPARSPGMSRSSVGCASSAFRARTRERRAGPAGDWPAEIAAGRTGSGPGVMSPRRAPAGVRVHWRPSCPSCAMLRLGLLSGGSGRGRPIEL